MGLTDYATLPSGTYGRNVKFPNPKPYRKALAALKRYQRDQSRRKDLPTGPRPG
ncbi:hypothetical protein [Roseibium sp. RKSG952]|uniref:hypothetical protein n=1 Tax=Roseibium sp. RKSG952 TaxID=2529384 RepID=UPI0012BB5C63|nr:hypothetical protein [Roseibium sp. RKSG952]